MKNVAISCVLFWICCSCIKQDDLSINSSIKYQPEFSVPLGKPDILMDEFVGSVKKLHDLPDSLVSDTTAFCYEDNYYELPGRFTDLYTEEFTFSLFNQESDKIESLMIRTNVHNRIPGKVAIQVYFADSSFNYLDSLYYDGYFIVDGAPVDNNGDVEGEVFDMEDSYFEKDEIDRISEMAYIIIYSAIYISNIDDGITKYYSNQDITIQMAACVGLNIELK